MQFLGPSGLFQYAAAMALMLGGFTLYRIIRREPVPLENHVDFVPVPRTTPVILELVDEGEGGAKE